MLSEIRSAIGSTATLSLDGVQSDVVVRVNGAGVKNAVRRGRLEADISVIARDACGGASRKANTEAEKVFQGLTNDSEARNYKRRRRKSNHTRH